MNKSNKAQPLKFIYFMVAAIIGLVVVNWNDAHAETKNNTN